MPRIDIELVNRNIVNSRARAQESIKNGLIYCNNKCITKCSFSVCEDDILELRGEPLKYVSRGGLKLEKAINTFNINLKNKVMCDIGSSTGGFSDCALQNGIDEIYAIDVGSNQLHDSIRSNPKVHVMENTDFRNIDINLISKTQIVTIDVSFISVTKLVPKISELPNCNEIVCLVKPQFECGKENADKFKGVVLSKSIHFEVITNIISAFKEIHFLAEGLTSSPIKGGSGNIEYLLYLKLSPLEATSKNNIDSQTIQTVINSAFKNSEKK